MIELSVEGNIKFDPKEEDLEGRIAEILVENGDIDHDEARREVIGIILHEIIGHTGFLIDYWHEV
jgi:hypothetical protein